MSTVSNLPIPIVEGYWSSPIPLKQPHEEPLPYPTQCLPTIIHNAVMSYQAYGKQPVSMIACSALANISLACQNQANVARDKFLISPISLYFLILSISGSRKSITDTAFSQATREWEKSIQEELEPEVIAAKTLHQAWHAEKESVLSKIRKAASNKSDATEFQDRFITLMHKEPQIPLVPTLFFEDTTQEAIAAHISNGWPSASIWSDEAAIVFNGHGMQSNTTKFISLLNRLWDGKDFITHRKTSKSFTISNRRLTVSLMLQPLLMQQMIEKNQGIIRQSGFMARNLIAYPENTMGTRFYEEPTDSLVSLQKFHHRITQCLNHSLSLDKSGCHQIPTLFFSEPAKSAWIKHFNEIESALAALGEFASITDFASKAAENAARLAALFHLFEGKTGDINYEDIERAIQIVRWHLSETKRVLTTTHASEEFQDAIKLISWITAKDIQNTTPQYLQQYSPVRDKKRRNAAIEVLIAHNYARKINNYGKTALVINPDIVAIV